MGKKVTTKEFIERARDVHGNKYDYSKVEYINNYTKVCIICPTHGEFWQTPNKHLLGHGCPACGGSEKLTTNIFIEKAMKIHDDKYDYSKVEYINAHVKVCIVCPIHGEFWQTPNDHLCGKGCPKCSKVYMDKDYFIERAEKVHGDKYNYDKVDYISAKTNVCIVCPIHGEFWQQPYSHLNGCGCPKCADRYMDKELFIEKARAIHGDKYNYDKVEYINNSTKVCLICPIHGEFWQAPSNHLNGNGCSKCNSSKLELNVENLLKENNIKYKTQYKLNDCKYKDKLPFDFYLPTYNIAIECQGGQHFIPVERFGGKKTFKLIQKRDRIKYDYCKTHGIKLLYFANKEEAPSEYLDKIITNEEDLLREIYNGWK